MEQKEGFAAGSRVHSLAQFLETQICEGTQWAEFVELQDVPGPETSYEWVEDHDQSYGKFDYEFAGLSNNDRTGPLRPKRVERLLEASENFRRLQELRILLANRFRQSIKSGTWDVWAIPPGGTDHVKFAPALICEMQPFDFVGNCIGELKHVEVRQVPSDDLYLLLKWFIEKFCGTIPPGQRASPEDIRLLAARLLKVNVRDDMFKFAWANADKPPPWSVSGPKPQFRD